MTRATSSIRIADPPAAAPCGHPTHVGTCAGCQQRKLAVLEAHNAAAIAAASAWRRQHATRRAA